MLDPVALQQILGIPAIGQGELCVVQGTIRQELR